MEQGLKHVIIYTDGACSGNPGPGGYAAILSYNGHKKEISGGEKSTTNNRMEITAVIKGLEALKTRCKVDVYSDSKYVIDSIQKGWVVKWKKNNWMRNKTQEALNVDLWDKLLELINRHEVHFHWVKGHDGNEENERCDFLATSEAKKYK